jgi:cytidyltransferase-like protein
MSVPVPHIVVSGGFDDLRRPDIRFLEEAARLGTLDVLLWSDDLVRFLTGQSPQFPWIERQYFLQALRWVRQVHLIETLKNPEELPAVAEFEPSVWVVREQDDTAERKAYAQRHGLTYEVMPDSRLEGYPQDGSRWLRPQRGRKKVIVTGCYDWFHTGHIRFFEEVSALGDLYVVVGSDANVRQLKGPGHPMFSQQERRYLVGSIRYVFQALISTGTGWMDAAPQIEEIKPDIYAVNEDGDRPEKRRYCEEHGIEYTVLRRLPKPGLPRRQSTKLRGF